MIPNADLRIGNLFIVDYQIWSINKITNKGVNYPSNKYGVDIYSNQEMFSFDYIEPIPLSPSILKKCGFEKENGMMCWEYNGVKIAYETLAKFYRLYPYTHPIKYLHQLQNLIHSLTGEELTYKQ